jgi:hypothetical protein
MIGDQPRHTLKVLLGAGSNVLLPNEGEQLVAAISRTL